MAAQFYFDRRLEGKASSRRSSWQRRWMQTASAAASIMLGLLIGSALQEPPQALPAAASMLAVLGSAPPGALCARPELCYLKVNLK